MTIQQEEVRQAYQGSPGCQLGFGVGQHRLVARPSGGLPGTLPRVTWSRQIEIDPRVRGFKLQFNEADFK